jgi:hypothetical protein
MSQGQLWLFSKNKISGSYVRNVVLTIEGTFSIEDNLNDTPSNTKIKSTTSATYREEFEVNTIAYHPDTTTWWVIKSDVSTYIQTGEYEHEIELVELLEFYSYRHLPNCAFAPNTYTLQQMLNRVFSIGKQNDIILASPFPPFLDPNKQMPFMSFENFTIANAIKNIARSINAIPKVIGGFVDITGTIIFTNFTLTFINRNGIENTILNGLNDQFQTAYERNANTSDQFLTRSVSNIQNAKSSSLVVAPLSGGFKSTTPDTLVYDNLNTKVFLPSKIDSIEFLRVFFEVGIYNVSGNSIPATSTLLNIYKGYFFNKETLSSALTGYTDSIWNSTDIANAINNLPEPLELFKVFNTGTIDSSNLTDSDNFFFKKMIVKSKFDFDSTEDTPTKDRTAHWTPFTNELIMPLSFRNGLEGSATSYSNSTDHNTGYTLISKTVSGTLQRLMIRPLYDVTGIFNNFIPMDKILIQVGYYPIADIKVSYDNDNEAQDERFFNQSGKIIDATSVTKLITSHTNDSVEGTKIRNAKYTTFSNILPLGQLVRDNNQIYVISQRSIDCQFANENNYFNVIYTLSRNRVARSENIQAENSVINYKIPDENLVSRSQLYKDYIELSLTNGNKDTSYLPMAKSLAFTNTIAGTIFDYVVLAKNTYDSTTMRYVKSPSIFDLHRAKLVNVNWQDNNVLGYRLDPTTVIFGTTFAQTPILYTNNVGKATDFEVLFLDRTNLNGAIDDYNTPTIIDTAVPFSDLTQVPTSFYNDDVLGDNRFTIRIQEPTYDKDAFEIPVFEYMIQANDNYDPKGNVIVSNELFTTFTSGLIRYHYIVSNTRFTAENADKLWLDNPPASDVNRVLVSRTNNTTFTLRLFSTLISEFPPLNLNTTALQNKHIGFFAVGADGSRKFLWGINDYTMASNNEIVLYINNWRI